MRSRRQVIGAPAAVAAAFAIVAVAQSPPPATGSISGHVICGDNNRPARGAWVHLLHYTPPEAGKPPQYSPPGSWVEMATGLNGEFQFGGVKPGDYYVVVDAEGYISAAGAALSGAKDTAQVSDTLARLQEVHVSPGKNAIADSVLQRGAVITGTVRYDDGSPASGISVTLGSGQVAERLTNQFMGLAMAARLDKAYTDDRGQYRFSGVAPGEHEIVAELRLATSSGDPPGPTSPLLVYAPDRIHEADAAKVKIKGADQVGEVDITVPLDSLHTVSGQVVAIKDGHGINRAEVAVAALSDKTFHRSAFVSADGSYSLNYLPAGTYQVQVTDAADTETLAAKPGDYGITKHAFRFYEPVTQTVQVLDDDVTDENFRLVEDKTHKPEPEHE